MNIASLRPVMIHAQLLEPSQMKRVADCGIIPSFFAAHIIRFGDTHIKNFGLARASQISRLASALKYNIPFTLHQDSPVIKPDMLEKIEAAVQRKTRSGIVLGENEHILVQDALRSVTLNAANQYFEKKDKGSIVPGIYTGMIILDNNLLTIKVDKLSLINVLYTIFHGLSVNNPLKTR